MGRGAVRWTKVGWRSGDPESENALAKPSQSPRKGPRSAVASPRSPVPSRLPSQAIDLVSPPQAASFCGRYEAGDRSSNADAATRRHVHFPRIRPVGFPAFRVKGAFTERPCGFAASVVLPSSAGAADPPLPGTLEGIVVMDSPEFANPQLGWKFFGLWSDNDKKKGVKRPHRLELQGSKGYTVLSGQAHVPPNNLQAMAGVVQHSTQLLSTKISDDVVSKGPLRRHPWMRPHGLRHAHLRSSLPCRLSHDPLRSRKRMDALRSAGVRSSAMGQTAVSIDCTSPAARRPQATSRTSPCC